MLPMKHVILCILCTLVQSSAAVFAVFVRGCPGFVRFQVFQVTPRCARCRCRRRRGRFVSLTPTLPARRRSCLLDFVTKQRFTQNIFGRSLQSFLPVELNV